MATWGRCVLQDTTYLDHGDAMQVLLLCTVGEISKHGHVLHESLSGSAQVSCHAPLISHLTLLVCEEGAAIFSHYLETLVKVEEEREVALEAILIGHEAIAYALQ